MTALTSLRVVEGEARHFGAFDLIAKLGRGGMAEAFLAARVERPAELLVVKRLTPDFAHDAEYRSMFEAESRIMPLFSHPNVVRTFEAGEHGDLLFVAMEFLDGLPLEQCSTEIASLGAGAAAYVIPEVLDGLHYVHELRGADGLPLDIVHRDMSPHNVFVTYEGRVTVVDFGIAKMRGRANHTSTGVVRGKLSYMAPEQALCDLVDRRADVFAVGVMLWELLSGERFWGQLSEVQILKHMTFGEMPRREAPLPISEQLAEVVARAIAFKPEERFGSAREFREALLAACDTPLRRLALGKAVQDAAAEYRGELSDLVQQYLSEARGTADLFPPTSMRGAIAGAGQAPEDDEIPDSARLETVERTSVRQKDLEISDSSRHPAVAAAATNPRPDSSEVAAFTQTGGASAVDLAAVRPPSRGRLAGALALVAALGVGGLLWSSLRGSANRSPQLEEPVPAAPTTGSPTASAESWVTLTLDAAPADAEVYFDEMRVTELPFAVKLRKDGVGHSLRAEAPGHLSHSRIVVLDRDTEVMLKLDPVLVPDRTRPPTVRTGRPAATSRPSQPATQPTAPPVVDGSDPWRKKQRGPAG